MKISTIQNNLNIRHDNYNLNTLYPKHRLIGDLTSDLFVKSKHISFRGSADIKSVSNDLSYNKFITKYHNVYGNKPMNEVIAYVIKNNEELNHGKEKRIFIFPKMEEYLIAHLYNKPPLNKDFSIKKCTIKHPEYNFGQPIAKNGYDILIRKHLPGVPSSVDNFMSTIQYVCKNNCATKSMAQEYLSKLRLFENFPQESYDNLAHQIKYLSEKGIFADIINCNNLLIDADNQKFHLIDLLSDSDNILKNTAERIGGAKQGAYDMISLLLDPRFQLYYLEQMSPQEQKETESISKNVIKKCFTAAKKASLSTKKDFVNEFFKLVQKRHAHFGENLTRRYSEFLELYGL